jgi:hypothetical protein
MEVAMKSTTTTMRTIDLGHEQLFVLDGGRDTRVRVLFGGTWLTEEGSGDSIVHAGEEVTLLRDGHAVLEGLGPTRVQIVESAQRGPLQWIARWRQQTSLRLRLLVEKLHLGARAAIEPNG